jgi:hypothetical protein
LNAAAESYDDDESPQREAHAIFFRAMVDFLKARHLTDGVRARVPERVRRAIENPPPPQCWLPSQNVDEIVRAVQELGGPPIVVQLGKYVARQMAEGRLKPVIACIYAVLGKSPTAMFRTLNVSFSLAVRGMSFRYAGDFVIVHYRGGHVPDGAFHALRGSLLYIFELTGVNGQVGEPEPLGEDATGVHVRYRILF